MLVPFLLTWTRFTLFYDGRSGEPLE